VWNPGDATNLSIGQGFLLATPLQMANYASALANDGIVWKPRLVTQIRDRSGAVVKNFGTATLGHTAATNTELSLIRDTMHAVTSDRDGTVAFVFQNYKVSTAGKSGTAESPAAGKVDAWFIGFSTFEQPSLAFAAILDEFTEVPGRARRRVQVAPHATSPVGPVGSQVAPSIAA
jgi:penicillin-binding protein 2